MAENLAPLAPLSCRFALRARFADRVIAPSLNPLVRRRTIICVLQMIGNVVGVPPSPPPASRGFGPIRRSPRASRRRGLSRVRELGAIPKRVYVDAFDVCFHALLCTLSLGVTVSRSHNGTLTAVSKNALVE